MKDFFFFPYSLEIYFVFLTPANKPEPPWDELSKGVKF